MSDSHGRHEHPPQNAHIAQRHYDDATTPGLSMSRGGHKAASARTQSHSRSPSKKDQKHVVFQLIDPQDPRIQARLPMRVMIQTHDTTDSIITTVKNFYGLYEYGVSFENKDGISIIAAYENFDNDMIVYVRTVAHPIAPMDTAVASPRKVVPSLGAPFEMRPQSFNPTHSHNSRPEAKRSMSPHADQHPRNASTGFANVPQSHRMKSKDHNLSGEMEGYSSCDNDGASVTSSRRSKTEQVNADISVTNIVEGGRRKRAFESSV